MAKQIFSNIDFSGNAALNMVIGSLSDDPTGVAAGYFYYNTVRNCLRVLIGNTWRDLTMTSDGNIIRVVNTLPATGESNVIYLLRMSDINGEYARYSTYVWLGLSYGQTSGYKLKWSEIVDKPELLDCSVYLVQGSSDYGLNFDYRQY